MVVWSKLDRLVVVALLVSDLVACSGDETSGPDSGLVVVTLAPGGEPAAGVTVVFQDADGEIIGENRTGDDGRTGQEVARDSMVSFFLNDHMNTIAGVQPGDVLELTSMRGLPPDTSPVAGQVTVTAPDVDGATEYRVTAGCGTGSNLHISGGVTAVVKESCLDDDGTFALLVTAVDEAGATLAVGSRTALEMDPDGTSEVAIDWDAPPAIVEISYAGQEPQPSHLSTAIWWYRGDRLFASDDAMSDGAPIRLPHADLADSEMLRIGAAWADGDEAGGGDLVRMLDAPIADSYALTDDDLLARPSRLSIDISTRARPAASWEGDTAAADGLYLQLGFQSSSGTSGAWLVSLPPAATEFRFPALPVSLAAYAPQTGSTLDPRSEIIAIETDTTEGYTDFCDRYALEWWDSLYPIEAGFTTARHSSTGVR